MSDNTNIKDLELRSEEVQEILTNPPAWIIRWGITLIFVGTIAIILLACIIRYPDFVAATVVVTTEKPTERIIAKNSGPIEEFYVKNGDLVEPFQKLAIIRSTARIADVHKLMKIVEKYEFVGKKFEFPIDSTQNLVLGEIESSYVEFERSYLNYFLNNSTQPLEVQLSANQQTLVELAERYDDLISQKEIQRQELELKKAEFDRFQQLFQKGVISLQEFQSKKLEYLQMQKTISSLEISISQIREAAFSARQNIKETNISMKEDHVKFSSTLTQSLNNLKRALKQWEENYVLSSSISGAVSFQGVWGENQHVNAGEVVFSIFPKSSSSQLLGKLTVPSHMAGKIAKDQKVLVKLNNFPYQQYGMLIGRVKSISVTPDAEGNYIIYISLPQGPVTSYSTTLTVNQEMIGQAEVVTEDLSIAERIFYKFKNLFYS